MSEREKVRRIREIVKSEYNYTFTYNDRVATGRRIKMMQNGYKYRAKTYAKWDRAIKQKLKKANIEVKTAGFEHLERYGYGDYFAYVVRI